MEAIGKLEVTLATDKNNNPYRRLNLEGKQTNYYAFPNFCQTSLVDIDKLTGQTVCITFEAPKQEGGSRAVEKVEETTKAPTPSETQQSYGRNYQLEHLGKLQNTLISTCGRWDDDVDETFQKAWQSYLNLIEGKPTGALTAKPEASDKQPQVKDSIDEG